MPQFHARVVVIAPKLTPEELAKGKEQPKDELVLSAILGSKNAVQGVLDWVSTNPSYTSAKVHIEIAERVSVPFGVWEKEPDKPLEKKS